MIRDADIQEPVVEELNREPRLEDEDIAVGVREGVMTLAGYVESFLAMWDAERIASRLRGVNAEKSMPNKLPAVHPA